MKQQQKLQCLLRETKKARPCRGLNRETPCHPVSLGNQGNFARSEVSRVKQGTKEPRKQHAARSFRGEPGKRGNKEPSAWGIGFPVQRTAPGFPG